MFKSFLRNIDQNIEVVETTSATKVAMALELTEGTSRSSPLSLAKELQKTKSRQGRSWNHRSSWTIIMEVGRLFAGGIGPGDHREGT
jgi:hypothetical protein